MASPDGVIEGRYLSDILNQPGALEDTLAGLKESGALADTARRLGKGEFQRIVLTGMGSSLHALHPLQVRLLNHGWTSIMLETSELVHYAPGILDAATLLIAVSQSGRSAEILRLLEVRKSGCVTVAITNTPDSPLAERSQATVLTHAGAEFTVSTKTYVAALMALAWTADLLTQRDLSETRRELAEAAPAVAAYLSNWKAHVRELVTELAGVRRLFVLGRGPSLASAGTAGLIIKESTHFHAEGMSAAAFRHGPFEMLSGDLYALVFSGDPPTAELNRKMVRDIVRAGGRAALVGEGADPGVFRLPQTPAAVRPILEILPVEMITLALAALTGREAGRFERASKITAIE